LRDLSGAYQFRTQILWLNTELFLLHGFSYIPRSIGLECMLFPTKWFTRSLWKNRKTLAAIAQVERVQQNGRFNWIIAPEHSEEHALQPLLDQVCFESGQRGCLHLTASIEDTSPVVEEFKLNGFTQLGWEHILQYMKSGTDPVAYKTTWRKMKPQDLPAISVLRNKTASLAEKWTLYSTYDNPPQYTLELNGEIAGFAFVIQNGTTAVIIPTISKHVHSPEKLMQSLIHSHFSNF